MEKPKKKEEKKEEIKVIEVPDFITIGPVSYTHLDVYKRQKLMF